MGAMLKTQSPQKPVSYGWLWPGLPQMWEGGQWSGFLTAAGFAVGLQVVVLATCIWDEWFTSAGLWGLKLLTVGVWIAGAMTNRRWISRRLREARRNAAEDLFPTALAEYLQGNWFVAEQKCRDLIRRNREDVDARLLLATLLRHADRPAEARTELVTLERCDGAGKWALEIAHERRLLDEAELEKAEIEADEMTANPYDGAIRRAA